MKAKGGSAKASYEISNVRGSAGKNEYVITVTKNGQYLSDVKVRATTSAPAYYDDTKQLLKAYKS